MTVCSPARSSQQTGFHQGHTWADRNDLPPAVSRRVTPRRTWDDMQARAQQQAPAAAKRLEWIRRSWQRYRDGGLDVQLAPIPMVSETGLWPSPMTSAMQVVETAIISGL